jgi:hypothetical protein
MMNLTVASARSETRTTCLAYKSCVLVNLKKVNIAVLPQASHIGGRVFDASCRVRIES